MSIVHTKQSSSPSAAFRAIAGMILLCGVSVAACIGSAQADVTSAVYINSQGYNYKITDMPDLDQLRGDLPSDGAMYCAPTSAVNLFAYAANHGFPTPGLPDWTYQSQSHYEAVTAAIELMGTYMQTDPQDGTTCCIGGALFVWDYPSDLLKYTTRYLTDDYTPGIAKMTSLACSGWIMGFAYGKYHVTGTSKGYPILDRVGGHVVTLASSWRDGTARLLVYRDPSKDTYVYDQSNFIGTLRGPFDHRAWYPNVGLRTMAGLFFSDSGDVRVMDSHFGIRPIMGIHFIGSPAGQESAQGVGGGTIERLDPIPFEGSNDASLPSIVLPSSLKMLDMQLNPGSGNALVIAASSVLPLPSKLRTLDLITGAMVILPDAPSGLLRMDVNRFDQIFAFDASGVAYRMDEEGGVHASATIGADLSDIAVDDSEDTVWLLSVAHRHLYKVSRELSVTLLSFAIPANVPMSGEGQLVIDPTTHIPYIKTDGSVKFWRITPPTQVVGAIGTAINLSGVGTIQSLFMGDEGTLFVSDGTLHAFNKAANGTWTPDSASPFNGMPGSEHLAMLKSTTNFDPSLHSGPAWQNIQPSALEDNGPEVPDCAADFNGDFHVDGADLGMLLGAWGTNSVFDLNGDHLVDGADLGVLLGMWGNCP